MDSATRPPQDGLTEAVEAGRYEDGELVPGLTAADLITDKAVVERDDDALDYMAFVRQLARLVASADCPVNIALFGPWGSGKSTVGNLLKTEIARNARSDGVAMPFVRYDAWRFAGLSLQRSFISEAAEGLGINREPYHRSLYQDRRTGGFRLRTLLRSLPVGLVTFSLALAGVIALATGLVALAAVVGGKDVGDELRRQAPTLLPVAGLIALFTAIARPFLDAAGVQVSEGAPVAAEQFRLTFQRLIKDGLRRARRITVRVGHREVWVWPLRRFRRPRDRVVFFIDELDRCSPEDVVEALRALKTFLEVDGCAFLVAADRDVLEEALDRLPQTTPLNEEAPYFSSAGSFLDKVFQYQVPLPLLRGGRRLRTYAGTLVRKPRKGLWWEIHDHGRLLDDIVYTLIPSHVRSPRRVKVLLNKFAVNARIAGAHGIVWMERAEEIAKLTVLQTEFPAVAADLRREPRLPELLLHPPRAPSPLVAELLERHDVGAGRDSGAIGSRAQATSRLLTGAGRAGMVDAQRGELRRYLERTATVPDARRDLLFLETGGRTVGLDDAQLMDEIETMAPSAPDQVSGQLSSRASERQRLLAAEVLLDMSERAVGREKRNIITLLVQTVDGLPNEATQVADRVTTAVRIFSDTYDLPHELLAPALRISALQQVRFPVELTNLLREGGLWSERKTVLSVLDVAALTGQLDRIERSIVTSVRRWPGIVAEAIRGPRAGEEEGLIAAPLPREAAEAVLALEGVAQALADAIDERAEFDEEGARELTEELYEAGTRRLSRGEVSITAIPLLAHVRSRMVYDVVREASERLDPHPGTPEARCSQALAALRHPHCDPRDWEHWRRGLEELDSKDVREGQWAVEGMRAVLERFRGLKRSADQEAASDVITALAGLAEVAMDDEDAQAELIAAAQAAIAGDWWNGPRKRGGHRHLHATIRALTLADPVAAAPKHEESFASRLWQVLADDLRRALRSVDAPSRELVDVVRDLAAELPPEYSARLSDDMERVATAAIDVEWATRFRDWLREGLEQIGADEETIAELQERAGIERLKTILDPVRFASIKARLEPLIAGPPDAAAMGQVAIELDQSLGTTGTRFSQVLIQSIAAVDREALHSATRAATEHGSRPDQRLRSAVDQAAGGSLLDGPGEIQAVGALRVAAPRDVEADRLTAEIVIVGSGAAGGVLAHRLAKAGRSVLILERGELIDPGTMADRSTLVRQALGDTRADAWLQVLQAHCVGGSTLIGDGIPAPLPRSVLDGWDHVGGPLKELADRKTFDRLAVELDLRMPKKVRYEAERGKPREGRELTLLAEDRAHDRLSMIATLLPRAQQLAEPGKVELLSDCRVERVRATGRRIRLVDCRLGDGRRLEVDAEIVVLAAGAIQSSAILRRSRLGGDAVGRNLHFNLTALLLAEYTALDRADEVRYFESMDDGYVSVTSAADARGPVAGMPGWFEDIAQGRRGEGPWMVSAVTIGSTGTGEVHVPEEGRSRSRFVFRPGEDIKRLAKALRHVGDAAFRNGARSVRPATPRRQLDIRPSTLDDLVRHIAEPGDLLLTSGQPLGGNPMGSQARGGVVDDDFRVHGTDNLYVCDASVMPTATTVYPQLSVMALADSAATRLGAAPDERPRARTRLRGPRRRTGEPTAPKAEKGPRRR